jgi:sulfite reductase alpha subunit-like flavoprotein
VRCPESSLVHSESRNRSAIHFPTLYIVSRYNGTPSRHPVHSHHLLSPSTTTPTIMLTQHFPTALPTRSFSPHNMSSTLRAPPNPMLMKSSSHPEDPIPEEPKQSRQLSMSTSDPSQSPRSQPVDEVYSDDASSIDTTPSTPPETSDDFIDNLPHIAPHSKKRRASTILVSQGTEDVNRILGLGGTVGLIQKTCCGGGCCKSQQLKPADPDALRVPFLLPDSAAYRSLDIRLGQLALDSELLDIVEMPPKTVSFEKIGPSDQPQINGTQAQSPSEVLKHPPNFVQPHPPYQVFSAPLYHARELTKPGAEKRTFHFDLDVTDYPVEGGDVDFVVGGAIGVCAPNPQEIVNEVFDRLGIPSFVRDKPVLMKTVSGRWPTIWGEDEARELVTTRRELLTWCTDLQSYPPTKQIFRLLAQYAEDEHEKKILLYLSSAQGQAAFCDLRTGPYITILQVLTAFPSSRPPLDHLLSILNQLMPRFYSLSQDPKISATRDNRRIIEIAVTVHESVNYDGVRRTGVGSGHLERLARQVIDAEAKGINPRGLDLRVPMFRGLMANPLAREFVTDGPMLLIGAGVGVAPFRGFVHSRLKSANCANKVWVMQGIRDSEFDELYQGDWGQYEDKVKKVVQSRKAVQGSEAQYVQHEILFQADLVWFIINALDGRVFVCGSSKGMGEGVWNSLVEVAMKKGKLNREEAEAFWEEKRVGGQYVAETW